MPCSSVIVEHKFGICPFPVPRVLCIWVVPSVLWGIGKMNETMVLDATITLETILAASAGFASKFIVDEITRRWRQRVADHKDKIKWYNQLITLANEINIALFTRAKHFDYLTEEANLPEMNLLEFFNEGEMEQLRTEAAERGIEIPERSAFEEWSITKEQVQDRIRGDMAIYEERLVRHIAQHPADVNEETISIAASLVGHVSGAGLVGPLNEEYVRETKKTVDQLVYQCNVAIEELESERLL